jgi:hypothetical protein
MIKAVTNKINVDVRGSALLLDFLGMFHGRKWDQHY